MKNVLTIVKKEFARFFKDKRMIITVLLPGILIYIVYSLMGMAFSNLNKSDADTVYTACVVDMPENTELSVTLQTILDIQDNISFEQAQERISEGSLDLLIVFPEGFDLSLSNPVTVTPDVKIYFNSSKTNSYNGYIVVSSVLEAFKNPAFSVNASGNYDLAEEREATGKLLASIMPLLMLALLVSGCMAVAPEAIAGEKERGTMATMLITPISRWQLALGKIISLSCFAMLSGISSFIGVLFSLPKLMGGFVSGETAALYTAGDYFMIFGLIISLVLVIISAFSILSTLAKSVKEAGTMIGPFMIVLILLGLGSVFISSLPALGLFAIPLFGSVLALSAIMSFTITAPMFVLALISNLVLAAVLIVVLSFMFKSERIMFNR